MFFRKAGTLDRHSRRLLAGHTSEGGDWQTAPGGVPKLVTLITRPETRADQCGPMQVILRAPRASPKASRAPVRHSNPTRSTLSTGRWAAMYTVDPHPWTRILTHNPSTHISNPGPSNTQAPPAMTRVHLCPLAGGL